MRGEKRHFIIVHERNNKKTVETNRKQRNKWFLCLFVVISMNPGKIARLLYISVCYCGLCVPYFYKRWHRQFFPLFFFFFVMFIEK